MNKDNNITNINEYRENMMPDASAFNINQPNNSVEYVSEELLNSYVWEIGNSTPDLWSRIEAGFEAEAKEVIRERKRKSARAWRTFGYVAAALLITVIAIPVMKLGGSKSEDTKELYESTTASYDTEAACSDSVAMEAPADNVMESYQEETIGVETNSQIAEEGSESEVSVIKGVQTDARQLTVVCEITIEDEDTVTFEVKEIKLNQYEDISINVGDKITLSNPLFVYAVDMLEKEEEITLDSIELDQEGKLLGRIIYVIN